MHICVDSTSYMLYIYVTTSIWCVYACILKRYIYIYVNIYMVDITVPKTNMTVDKIPFEGVYPIKLNLLKL